MSKKKSPTNEATGRILKFLYDAGVYAWRQNVLPIPLPNGGFRPASKSGQPDIMGIYGGRGVGRDGGNAAQGRFIGVEIKRGADRLRPEQEGFHFTARKLGGYIFVAVGKTADEIFNDFLRQWTQAKM